MRIVAAAVLVFLVAFEASAQLAPASPPSVASLERSLREHPRDPTAWFFLARARAQAGDPRGCVAALEKVEAFGDGFMPVRDLGFERVWDDTAFRAVRARMEAKLPRLDFAPTAFELADRLMLPVGIAYDAPSHDFFVGSLEHHTITRVDPSQAQREFAGPALSLDPVLGLAVDSPRRLLYAITSTAVTEAGAAHPRNTLFAFEIDTRRIARRIEIPEARRLARVTVAFGGRVYASDAATGAIFEIAGDAAPRVVVPAGRLQGSLGLAASPDGRTLYVADATGIAVVDLAHASVKPLAAPPRENLAGIDGLYQWQGALVAVQNTTTPGRVIVLTLASGGGRVTRVQTLLSSQHTALDMPTTGAITENGFFLLAGTGLTHYMPVDGAIRDPDGVARPLVLRVPLPR